MKIKTWMKYNVGFLPTPRCRKLRYREEEEYVDIELREVSVNQFLPAFDAEGLTILAEKGSAGDKTVTGLSLTPTTVSAQKDTLLEVKSGSNKVAVIDKLMAEVLVGEGSANPDLTYVDVNFELEQFGIGLRKDDVATTFAIEKAIEKLVLDGTYAKLLAKYFG